MTQPDLTAASLALGTLVDTKLHDKVQHARDNGVNLTLGMVGVDSAGQHHVMGKPLDEWITTRIRLRPHAVALLNRARENGIPLSPDDIKINGGELTIDRMPADQWLDAMTME